MFVPKFIEAQGPFRIDVGHPLRVAGVPIRKRRRVVPEQIGEYRPEPFADDRPEIERNRRIDVLQNGRAVPDAAGRVSKQVRDVPEFGGYRTHVGFRLSTPGDGYRADHQRADNQSEQSGRQFGLACPGWSGRNSCAREFRSSGHPAHWFYQESSTRRKPRFSVD